jgi:hypothetical protein
MKKPTKRKCIVYWIRLPEHTDIYTQGYVGITIQYDVRMRQHSRELHEANIYGWENLEKSIVAEFGSEQDARVYERVLRDKDSIGWNKATGGGGGFTGHRDSDETKKKKSDAKKGVKFSAKHCAGISAARMGIKFSDEHRANISAGGIGIALGAKNGNFKGAVTGTHRDTGEVVRFEGATAIKKGGFCDSQICAVIKGKRPHHKNYVWTREAIT